LAGWSLVATVLLALLFVAIWLLDYLVRHSLKHHE
jgi:hypothetical protein